MLDLRRLFETRGARNAPQRALGSAAALCERGRYLDAIDALTEANREGPSPLLEAQLVTVRNRAFDQLGAPGSSYPEPVSVDTGVAPEDGGLPVVRGEDLSAPAIRGALLDRGCLLVRNLIDEHDAERLRNGIERAFEDRDAYADAPDPQPSPWFSPFEPDQEYRAAVELGRGFVSKGSGVWTADSPRLLFGLLEMFEAAGLREIIGAYLGERPALSLNKGTLRRAAPTVGTEWWHQDGAFLGDGIRSLNIWLALSHCGRDAPGLEVVPRRIEQIVETGTQGADFDWSVGSPVVEQVSSGALSRPVFAPGDAMLFDHFFLHRTGSDPGMTATRYAIETWFFAPSAYPDPQRQIPLAF